MGKGKPRHNPKKRQNTWGSFCPLCERIELPDGTVILHCELFFKGAKDTLTCKGNRHNCVKIKYKRLASRSDIQKINSVI